MKHICEEIIYRKGYGFSYPHGVTAKYEHLGKWYCKTHHPPVALVRVKEQDRKWNEEWDAKRDAATAKAATIREAEQRVLKAAYSSLSPPGVREPTALLKLHRAFRDLQALGWEPGS